MKNILIIGYGQIGKSIEKLYDTTKFNVFAMDTEKKDLPDGKNTVIDVMHICIPFTDAFKNVVVEYMNEYSPELTIINSTVAVGTTKEIYENIYEEEGMKRELVHSPCMGVHPDLTKSIQTFVKIIGGCTAEASELACNHFKSLDIDSYVYNDSSESELSKLLSTTYYSMCIKFMQNIHEQCENLDLSFDNVYTTTNNIYNEGYAILDKTNVIRPVLKYMGKGIGGHCCLSNLNILKDNDMMKDECEYI